MKFSIRFFFMLALLSMLGGCTSKITKKEQYSGFLTSYDNMQEVKAPSGEKALRWISPSWNPNAYRTVVFNRLEMYPEPQPNERIDQKTIDQLQAYMNQNIKSVVTRKYTVVPDIQSTQTGSGVLILRAAITGVNASNVGMKWYEIIPVAAVIGVTQAATGYRDQNTELYVEAEIIDANNGQIVARAVRKIFGKKLRNSDQKITADNFKEAIQKLGSDMQAFMK